MFGARSPPLYSIIGPGATTLRTEPLSRPLPVHAALVWADYLKDGVAIPFAHTVPPKNEEEDGVALTLTWPTFQVSADLPPAQLCRGDPVTA